MMLGVAGVTQVGKISLHGCGRNFRQNSVCIHTPAEGVADKTGANEVSEDLGAQGETFPSFF